MESGSNGCNIDRRVFLRQALGSLSALAGAGFCLCCDNVLGAVDQKDADEYDVLIPRVRYQRKFGTEQWNIHPQGEQNLLKEFARVFNAKVKMQKAYHRYGKAEEFNAVVDFESFPESGMYPFVFMTGQTPFVFSEKAEDNLVRFVNRGGFILMDDCVYRHEEDLFYQCCCDVLGRVFGDNFVTVEPTHPIFHNVFEMPDGLPYVQGVRRPAMGVVIRGRLSALVSSVDLHCGWIGRFFEDKAKFTDSIKMGMNILHYALTT